MSHTVKSLRFFHEGEGVKRVKSGWKKVSGIKKVSVIKKVSGIKLDLYS